MMMDPWEYITSLGIKHFHWNDPFFAEGNKKCHFLEKVPCIDLDDESVLHEDYGTIMCSVPKCNQTFKTVAEHAAHQRSCHAYSCATCTNSFPTHHLLDLHITEMHDSYFFIMAQRRPMYRCLLETCTEHFRDPQERKSHCMEDHLFPSNFRYDLSWKKIGKTPVGKPLKQTKKEPPSSMDCDGLEVPDSDLTIQESTEKNLAPYLKRPKEIPPTFSFGAGVPRGFRRQQRGRGNRGKGKGNRNQLYSTEHRKRGDGKIDMKDIEKALMEEELTD